MDAWRFIEGSNGYRLLTEAEWEYACRAGTETEYSMGNDESLLVSYCQMHPSKLAALCGEKIPNGWGLHDFHGNAYEWCEDLFNATAYRVIRGGSWNEGTVLGQSAFRLRNDPTYRMYDYGFRVALSPSVQSPEAEHNK